MMIRNFFDIDQASDAAIEHRGRPQRPAGGIIELDKARKFNCEKRLFFVVIIEASDKMVVGVRINEIGKRRLRILDPLDITVCQEARLAEKGSS